MRRTELEDPAVRAAILIHEAVNILDDYRTTALTSPDDKQAVLGVTKGLRKSVATLELDMGVFL